MVIDCHVHVSAFTAGHGGMSERLLRSLPFRFMRWRFGIAGADGSTERAIESLLARTIGGTPKLDAAVVLAFDAVYGRGRELDQGNTHLYVSNDYVIELSRRHRNMLFGASVHPYRKDAVAELLRCIDAGAVLVKWLPTTQGINPADDRCVPFYEVLAHHGVPLLCHTGGEQTLVQIDRSVADPMLLVPALKRGVTVIAAHCGSRSTPFETDYVPQFMRLAQEYEHLYGDTAALTLPTRWYAMDAVLGNPAVRAKLIHGSDWPIISFPPPRRVGWAEAWELMGESNWMKRDTLIKERLGLDEAYWQRAGKVLRVGLK